MSLRTLKCCSFEVSSFPLEASGEKVCHFRQNIFLSWSIFFLNYPIYLRSLLPPVSDSDWDCYYALIHGSLHFFLHGSSNNCLLFQRFLSAVDEFWSIRKCLIKLPKRAKLRPPAPCGHVKELKKLNLKHVLKVTFHFVWGHLTIRQTVYKGPDKIVRFLYTSRSLKFFFLGGGRFTSKIRADSCSLEPEST